MRARNVALAREYADDRLYRALGHRWRQPALPEMSWGRTVELIAVVATAFFAGWAANEARLNTDAGRDEAVHSLIFDHRLEAQRDYIKAGTKLGMTLREMLARTPDHGIDLEEPSQLASVTLQQLMSMTGDMRTSFSAYGDFEAAAVAAKGLWAPETEADLVRSVDSAREAIDCFGEVSNPPMNDAELPAKRIRLLRACAALGPKHQSYNSFFVKTLNEMIGDTRGTLAKMSPKDAFDPIPYMPPAPRG